MSVGTVKLKWSGEEYSETTRGMTHVEIYTVDTTNPRSDTAETAARAGGIPRRGDALRKNRNVVANEITARPVGLNMYEVTVHGIPAAQYVYEVTENEQPKSKKEKGDAKESISFVVSVEPVDRDAAGKPIVNSAQEPFDPPVTREQYDLEYTIVRNEPSFDEAEALKYTAAVNSDEWRRHKPGTCRLVRTGRKVITADDEYWQVTNIIRVRADGWGTRKEDKGYREATGDVVDGKAVYRNVRDENGHAMTRPVPLDGKGKRAAKGAPTVWLRFEHWAKLPFRKFGL